jgi:predicted TIM-barrel fold metal-dependent hydrolase
MIIDCHCHIASSKVLPKQFFDGWSATIKRNLPYKLSTTQSERLEDLLLELNEDPGCVKLLQEMDVAGISKSVLLVIDFGVVFKDLELNIEELHLEHKKLIDHNDRFIAFSGIDPRRGREGLDLFEKAVKDWGFRGLKIYPPCGYSPSDERLFPFYEICSHRLLPVFVHTGPSSSTLSFKHTQPMDIDDAALNFPSVNFILGHAGVTWYREASMIALYRPNIYLDLSGFQAAAVRGDFQELLKWSTSRGLGRKLLFGTDWPIHRFLGTQSKWVNAIKSCESEGVVSKTDMENIFFNNIKDILVLE